MERYRADQTQGAPSPVPSRPGAWPGTGPAADAVGPGATPLSVPALPDGCSRRGAAEADATAQPRASGAVPQAHAAERSDVSRRAPGSSSAFGAVSKREVSEVQKLTAESRALTQLLRHVLGVTG